MSNKNQKKKQEESSDVSETESYTESENSNKSSSEKSENSSSYYDYSGDESTENQSESGSENSDSSNIDYSKNGDEFHGDVINNQYILLHKIGYGSFSSVWLAYDISDDRFYALKIQTPGDYEEGLQEVKIFEMIQKLCKQNKNIDTLMTLKHNFVLERDDNKYVVMVMDLMAGSLYDVIKTDKYHEGLPEEAVKKVEKQLLDSIKVLHNFDIIHTDIKPENVLVCGINKKYQKVIDKFSKLKLKEKFDENIGEIKSQYNMKNKRQKEKFRRDKYMILLEINKFIHEIIDFEDILSDRTSDLFTEDQINNIKIKLSDFGSIQYERDLKKQKWYPEVTTRYYRDPRVVLGLPYDKSIDIHAAECAIYEVKTGKIKYNPDLLKDEDENSGHSSDYYHLLLFLKDGLVNVDMLKKCKKEELEEEIQPLIKKYK